MSLRSPPLLSVGMLFLIGIFCTACVGASRDWRTASTESVGLAPRAEDETRAVVQVYAARTVR